MFSATATILPIHRGALTQMLQIATCAREASPDLQALVFRSLVALKARHGSLQAATAAIRPRRPGGRLC